MNKRYRWAIGWLLAIIIVGLAVYLRMTAKPSPGTLAIPARYTDAESFSEGLAGVQYHGKWGYIDTRGTFVIAPTYDDAEAFSEGLAAVERDDKWGYIDAHGKEIVPLQYDGTSIVTGNGTAVAERNGKWGWLNPDTRDFDSPLSI